MFTGIVEDIGRVIYFNKGRLKISSELNDIKPGDSLLVNGVCLTVTGALRDGYEMEVGEETLKITSFNHMKNGEKVNLERSLKLTDRVGGHFVYGHVYDTGKLISVSKKNNTVFMKITVDGYFIKKLVKKGSVAVEGVSLTVNEKGSNFFTVGLIPETLKRTNLGRKNKGDILNLEPDMILAAARNYE